MIPSTPLNDGDKPPSYHRNRDFDNHGSSRPSGEISRLSRSLSRARGRSLSVSTPNELNGRVKWIFFALGASVLLPWNSLITAIPYFLSRLDESGFKSTFNSYLGLSFTFTNFAFLAHATATSATTSSSARIRKMIMALVILLFLLAISPILPINGAPFFFFVIGNAILQACAGSYLQNAVVALASLFGAQAIQNVFTGQGAIGVVVSFAQYISAAVSIQNKRARDAKIADGKATSDDDAGALSAFLFFGLTTVFLVFTLGAHTLLTRTPAYLAVVKPFVESRGMLVEEEDLDFENDGEDDEDIEGALPEDAPFLSGSIELQVPGSVSILEVARMNIVYNFSVCYVFVITLSVFPPITSSILSVHTTSTHAFFSPVLFVTLHFLVFNIGDWLGRYICAFPSLLIWSSGKILSMSLARTLFIPLFLACNVTRPIPSSSTTTIISASTPLINSDIIYMLILLFFGVSNGYVSSLCMMAAPSLVHNPRLKKEQVDTAATVAQFCLVGGLFLGSLLSFGVRAGVCGGCNPFLG